MRKITSEEFKDVKEWYSEWIRFPQYVTTASIVILSFSLTNFVLGKGVPITPPNIGYLKTSWILLCISVLLTSTGLVAAYASFNIGSAIHLKGLLELFNMRLPSSGYSWVVRLCWVAWINVVLGVSFMLAGTLFLVLFTFHSLNI